MGDGGGGSGGGGGLEEFAAREWGIHARNGTRLVGCFGNSDDGCVIKYERNVTGGVRESSLRCSDSDWER